MRELDDIFLEHIWESDSLESEKAKHTQLERVFRYWRTRIATSNIVSAATSIPIQQIYQYKKMLENAGLLTKVRRMNCLYTGFPAWWFTIKAEVGEINLKDQKFYSKKQGGQK